MNFTYIMLSTVTAERSVGYTRTIDDITLSTVTGIKLGIFTP
jgi:hypothetical protein